MVQCVGQEKLKAGSLRHWFSPAPDDAHRLESFASLQRPVPAAEKERDAALLGQVRVDLVEQRLAQLVVLQQPAKLQQSRRIGHRLARQVDAHKVAQGLAVVDRVFQRLVARPYHCCRQYMRSMMGTPMGWRPTRPLLGYNGSMTPISRAQGTIHSIPARNFSRRVRFFFNAYSALAKLR